MEIATTGGFDLLPEATGRRFRAAVLPVTALSPR
jgi:hypothetical protein